MSKTKWRPGLMTWLVIGGLLLVNASVLLSGNDPQPGYQAIFKNKLAVNRITFYHCRSPCGKFTPF